MQKLGVNFINILCAHFALIFRCQKITKPNVAREKLLNLLSYKKMGAGKMLIKLTIGRKILALQQFYQIKHKGCI